MARSYAVNEGLTGPQGQQGIQGPPGPAYIPSLQNGLIADPGQAQGGCQLTADINLIEIVAASGDSATLPAATVNKQITVINGSYLGNAVALFPASGESINIGAAVGLVNIPTTLTSLLTMNFVCFTVGIWTRIGNINC